MTISAHERRAAALHTPSVFSDNAVRDLATSLTALLADCFALYMKTKNFHWHVSGPHFREYHLLLDDHAGQIFAMTDPVAERVRKIGGTTIRSIGQIARHQRLLDNDAEFVPPVTMLAELRDDNRQFLSILRELHGLCEEHGDVATMSLVDGWIGETESRIWFLFESARAQVATPA
jgi:starvation-inducible DNA-binding protein